MQSIRTACESDLAAIDSIVRRIWQAGGDAMLEARYGVIGGRTWQEWVSADITEELGRDLSHVIVTEVDGIVAGFASFSIDETRNIGTVGYNGVDTEYRGRGIGSAQIGWVLGELKQRGMLYARVTTLQNSGHAPARAMYERAGFEPLVQNVVYFKQL